MWKLLGGKRQSARTQGDRLGNLNCEVQRAPKINGDLIESQRTYRNLVRWRIDGWGKNILSRGNGVLWRADAWSSFTFKRGKAGLCAKNVPEGEKNTRGKQWKAQVTHGFRGQINTDLSGMLQQLPRTSSKSFRSHLGKVQFCRAKIKVLFIWSISIMFAHPFCAMIRIHAQVQEVISTSGCLYYPISTLVAWNSIIKQKVLCLAKFW